MDEIMKNVSQLTIKIAAFSGSLRKGSFTTELVKAFIQLAPEGVTVELIDISQLPLMNEDLETNLPQSVHDLHGEIERADAVLLATPEYNRSYTPALKNALDWGSRPEGENKWDGKPTAVIGCTPYSMGAFGAQNHLRQVLVYLNMPTLQQPEFYLPEVGGKFNEQGELTDKQTREKISEFWDAFIDWIKKVR
ncbi:MAG: NAD(P)H-dependent oxidoreductase [Acidobacteriota bacterium]